MENVLRMYKQQLDEIIREAESDGVVLTIELVSKKPLAMGNHRMVSFVREKRKLATANSEMHKALDESVKQAGSVLAGDSVKEPPFKISKSSIDLYRCVYPSNPALRLGQTFHQYFKLEKITNPEAKVLADRIYNADEVEIKDLIDYITDWSN
jgi:hypothetical protein